MAAVAPPLVDLNTTSAGSSPINLLTTSRGVVFAANDSTDDPHGRELWITDAAGTRLLIDITPGATGFDPVPLGSVGDRLFVTDLATRKQLKTIDLVSGTVVDSFGSVGTIAFEAVSVLGDRLLFPAGDSSTLSLYAIGTTPGGGVTKLATMFSGSGSFKPSLATMKGRVYFAGYTASRGATELWSTDGTSAGTQIVRSGSTRPQQLTVANDGATLYYVGGSTLYKSNGTSAGTVSVASGVTGADGLVPWGTSGVAFRQNFTIWRSDGTAAGTFKLIPGDQYQPGMPFVDGGGRLLFGRTTLNASSVWTSDGTTAGTTQVGPALATGTYDTAQPWGTLPTGTALFRLNYSLYAINPDATPQRVLFDASTLDITGGLYYLPYRRAAIYEGRLFFGASNNVDGNELWSSDGTAAGTSLRSNIIAFPNEGSSPFAFAPTRDGSRTFFWAKASGDSSSVYWTLMVSDASAGGTRAILRAVPGVYNASATPSPYIATLPDGRAVFRADMGVQLGVETYVTDGTPQGTQLLIDANPGSGDGSPNWMYPSGDLVYFTAYSPATGTELYRTDGTPAGTFALGDINAGANPGVSFSGTQAPVFAHGGLFYFVAFHAGSNWIYRTDGTVAGTIGLTPFNGAGWPVNFQAMGDRVWFTIDDGVHGREIWTSDGSAAGTRLLKDVNPGTASGAYDELITFRGRAYFSASDGASGTELWTSDGSADGTYRLADLRPGSPSSAPASFAVAGDRLFFMATAADGARMPFVTDGTAASTHAVVPDHRAGVSPLVQNVRPFVIGGAYLYLSRDEQLGYELFRTDGTLAGTYRLTDWLAPRSGDAASMVGGLLTGAFEGGAIFVFSTGSTSLAISTDGTLQGTKPLASMNEAGLAGIASAVGRVNGRLLLEGVTAKYGEELYAIDPVFAPTFNVALDDYDSLTPTLSLAATRDFGTSFTAADIELRNQTTGQSIPSSQLQVTLVDGRWRVRYVGNGQGTLPDGNYRLRIAAGSVGTPGGPSLADEFVFDFFVLAGDVNHDRKVDFADLLILAKHYNQSGRTFSEGNINRSPDGRVGFEDLLMLAKQYNQSLAAPAMAATVANVTPTRRRAGAAADVIG